MPYHPRANTKTTAVSTVVQRTMRSRFLITPSPLVRLTEFEAAVFSCAIWAQSLGGLVFAFSVALPPWRRTLLERFPCGVVPISHRNGQSGRHRRQPLLRSAA